MFIHDAILEAVLCGNTEVPARSLNTHIKNLTTLQTRDGVTNMEIEFKVCSNQRFLTFSVERRKSAVFPHSRIATPTN